MPPNLCRPKLSRTHSFRLVLAFKRFALANSSLIRYTVGMLSALDRLLAPALILFAACAAAAPATRPANIGPLLQAAQDRDPNIAYPAIRQLVGSADMKHPVFREAVQLLIGRDRLAITEAGRNGIDPAKIAAAEKQVEELRKTAWANIDALEKGEPIKAAHAYHDQLLDLVGQLNSAYTAMAALADAVQRRPELLTLWRRMNGGKSAPFVDADEAALIARGRALLAKLSPPRDDEHGFLWFYSACRRIDAYNSSVSSILSPGEFEFVCWLNRYRECLGAMPIELDARLTQSARRHSREMIDLNYFAHESPTAAEKTPWNRMENAGYKGGGGENIAAGAGSGEKAFWMWFDSPPHHKNMADRGAAAMGIGRWNSTWTLNTGGGKRLMLMSDAERAQVVIKGEMLPPQAR